MFESRSLCGELYNGVPFVNLFSKQYNLLGDPLVETVMRNKPG